LKLKSSLLYAVSNRQYLYQQNCQVNP